MASNGIPASEVVREAETAIHRAASLRDEARRILQQAEAIERNALKSATDLLGESLGRAAYGLAAWTVTGAAKDTEAVEAAPPDAVLPERPATDAEDSSAPAMSQPQPPASPVESSVRESQAETATAPSPAPKTEIHGVEIPPSRVTEAEDIIAQARAAVAQGRKSNPFSNDRGKNAWRKSLFKSAWDDLSAEAADNAAVPAGTSPSAASAPAIETDGRIAEGIAARATFRIPVADEMADLDEEELATADTGVLAVDHEAAVPADDAGTGDGEVQAAQGDGEPPKEAAAEPVADERDVPSETVGSSDTVPPEESSPSETVAASGESAAVMPDPLDDLDELPPPSSLPPPRGYPADARPVPGAAAASRPLAPPPAQARAAMPPKPSITRPPAAAQRDAGEARQSVELVQAEPQPSKQAAQQQRPASRPVPPPPAVVSGPSGLAMHTPVPVPPNRRPGNGQALQRPQQVVGPPGARHVPPSAPARPAPPSFMKR